MLAAGLGVAQNVSEAEAAARQAAAGGHPQFLTALGDLLCAGRGVVRRDVWHGAACYRDAVRWGDSRAADKLATLTPADLAPRPATRPVDSPLRPSTADPAAAQSAGSRSMGTTDRRP